MHIHTKTKKSTYFHCKVFTFDRFYKIPFFILKNITEKAWLYEKGETDIKLPCLPT